FAPENEATPPAKASDAGPPSTAEGSPVPGTIERPTLPAAQTATLPPSSNAVTAASKAKGGAPVEQAFGCSETSRGWRRQVVLTRIDTSFEPSSSSATSGRRSRSKSPTTAAEGV